MKTKVAEASGFGKMVFGTKEALIGYEEFLNKICVMCNNSREFINNINDYKKILIQRKKL